MLEKIHYILAMFCGTAMIVLMVFPLSGEEVPSIKCSMGRAVFCAGVYLVSKVLLLGNKK